MKRIIIHLIPLLILLLVSCNENGELKVDSQTGQFVNGGNNYNTDATIGLKTNFDLNFITNDQDRMTITYDGNVGVGTTTPKTNLEINGSVAVKTRIIDDPTNAVNADDYILLADATSNTVQVDLPSSSLTPGRVITIKKTDVSANNVTVVAHGSETIDGLANSILTIPHDYVTIVALNTGWAITSRNSYITQCPADMLLIRGAQRNSLCIERNSTAAISYANAEVACNNKGRRLCQHNEWATACDQGGADFVKNFAVPEWTSDSFLQNDTRKVIAAGGCHNSGANYGYANNTMAYRCCSR